MPRELRYFVALKSGFLHRLNFSRVFSVLSDRPPRTNLQPHAFPQSQASRVPLSFFRDLQWEFLCPSVEFPSSCPFPKAKPLSPLSSSTLLETLHQPFFSNCFCFLLPILFQNTLRFLLMSVLFQDCLSFPRASFFLLVNRMLLSWFGFLFPTLSLFGST